MKTSLKLTLGAIALGLSLSSFAQDNANTPASTKADPKVMIQIPDSAMKSGKVIIKDGQVYVRIGSEVKMDSGDGYSVKAVDLISGKTMQNCLTFAAFGGGECTYLP